MALSESQRHELHTKLEAIIGKEHAETIMSLLPPVGWADVATKHDLEQLESRIELRFEAVDARFDLLEAKMEAGESRIGDRIASTALKVNIPSILAAVALSFTAARFG